MKRQPPQLRPEVPLESGLRRESPGFGRGEDVNGASRRWRRSSSSRVRRAGSESATICPGSGAPGWIVRTIAPTVARANGTPISLASICQRRRGRPSGPTGPCPSPTSSCSSERACTWDACCRQLSRQQASRLGRGHDSCDSLLTVWWASHQDAVEFQTRLYRSASRGYMACRSGESAKGMTRARTGISFAMPSRRLAVALFLLAISCSMHSNHRDA